MNKYKAISESLKEDIRRIEREFHAARFAADEIAADQISDAREE